MPRDEFSAEVKDIVSGRVGGRCSNPNCRQPTSGPRDDPAKAVNVGVAAHISAASPGGPRRDPALTATERRSIDNAIWLCQTCAKLVDNDEEHYTVDLLRRWKRLSEEAARMAIEHRTEEPLRQTSDEDLIRFYAQCFDRPAFQDEFMREGSFEAFDKAIEDTITALNTGCLRSRDGSVLARGHGKAFLRNHEWREKMDVVVDLLRAIRARYEQAIREGIIHVREQGNGQVFQCVNDPALADWMDSTRQQIMDMFGAVAEEGGVVPPRFGGDRYRHRQRWQ